MTFPTSYLVRWIIWLAALLTIAGVLFVSFKHGHLTTAFYVIMFIVASLGVTLSFLAAKFIHEQDELASSQVEELTETNDVKQFIEQGEPSLFHTHIENLYTIVQNHWKIEQDALLNILHARLSARNRTAQLLSGILITLGLIGTIVGLILMMNRLQGSLADEKIGTSSDTDVLQTVLGPGGALEGLGTAYYTSLIGLSLGGVVLRILSAVNESSISTYIAHLNELTEVHVLPIMRRLASSLSKSGYYNDDDEEA